MVLSPIIQYGFAGMALLQLGVIVWLVGNLFKMLRDHTEVIKNNTEAYRAMKDALRELDEELRETRLARSKAT